MLQTTQEAGKLRRQIKGWTIFFIIGIAISGITAFPLVTELEWLREHEQIVPSFLHQWINLAAEGVIETSQKFPFIAYGTDWLAFAHVIIALLFLGVLKDPVRNKWVVEWAMLCCVLVFPIAFIAGPVRQIPFYHQVIDCCFGITALVPLSIVRKKIMMLERLK